MRSGISQCLCAAFVGKPDILVDACLRAWSAAFLNRMSRHGPVAAGTLLCNICPSKQEYFTPTCRVQKTYAIVISAHFPVTCMGRKKKNVLSKSGPVSVLRICFVCGASYFFVFFYGRVPNDAQNDLGPAPVHLGHLGQHRKLSGRNKPARAHELGSGPQLSKPTNAKQSMIVFWVIYCINCLELNNDWSVRSWKNRINLLFFVSILKQCFWK